MLWAAVLVAENNVTRLDMTSLWHWKYITRQQSTHCDRQAAGIVHKLAVRKFVDPGAPRALNNSKRPFVALSMYYIIRDMTSTANGRDVTRYIAVFSRVI